MKLVKFFFTSLFTIVFAGQVQAKVIENTIDEEEFYILIPCANNNIGEIARGVIRYHSMHSEVVDAAGGTHEFSHFQPMGGFFVGDDTGDTYIAVTEVFNESLNINSGGLPDVLSDVSNLRFIGKGKAVNFMLSFRFISKINESGEEIVRIDSARVICR